MLWGGGGGGGPACGRADILDLVTPLHRLLTLQASEYCKFKAVRGPRESRQQPPSSLTLQVHGSGVWVEFSPVACSSTRGRFPHLQPDCADRKLRGAPPGPRIGTWSGLGRLGCHAYTRTLTHTHTFTCIYIYIYVYIYIHIYT